MNNSNMKEFLTKKIKECYEKEFTLKTYGGSIFLYNTQTMSIDFWDSGEKDIYREKNIIHKYRSLIAASRSHSSNIRSGLIEVASHLEEKYTGLWLVTYNNVDGVHKVRDYVNYGIKMFINESVQNVIVDYLHLGLALGKTVYNFLEENNIYDPKFDKMSYFVIKDGFRQEVIDNLNANGIEFELVGKHSDAMFSFMLINEEDDNFLRLITNKNAFQIGIPIIDLRSTFIDPIYNGLGQDVKAKMINRYQNAEIKI